MNQKLQCGRVAPDLPQPGAIVSASATAAKKELVGDFPPAFEVCKDNVDKPTILVRDERGRPEVTIQWFGEAKKYDLGDRQFLFPLPTTPDNVQWFGHPEQFQVAYLDQVKNWPAPQAVSMIAPNYTGGVEAWVFMVSSSLYSRRMEGGLRAACFMGEVALLGDPNVGLISPRRFYDPKVNEANQRAVEK
ncbi:hypothetical protein KW800_00500 [Candidatus Parcubacteria bacterium]|nr:hypothetical protein [Candidatus Parcubacteria bacterium]